jgi:hypothetical protein
MIDRAEQQPDTVILKKTKVLPKLNDVRGWNNALSVGFCHGFFPQGAGKQQQPTASGTGAQKDNQKQTTDLIVFNPEKRWVSFKETKEKQLRTPVELELVPLAGSTQTPAPSTTTTTSSSSSVPLHAEVIHFEDHFTTADEYFHRLRVDEGDYHSYRHSGGFHWFVLQRANAPTPSVPSSTAPSNVDTSILRISKVKEVLHLRKMPNLKPKEELSEEALKRASRGKKAFKKSLKALRTEEDVLYSALDKDGDDAFEVVSDRGDGEDGPDGEGDGPRKKIGADGDEDAELEAEASVDRESGSGSEDEDEEDEREEGPASKKPRHESKDDGAAAAGRNGRPRQAISPPSDLMAVCQAVVERQRGKHVNKATVVNSIVKQSSEFSTWVERSDAEFDEWSRVARLETERCLAQLQCKVHGQDILFPL